MCRYVIPERLWQGSFWLTYCSHFSWLAGVWEEGVLGVEGLVLLFLIYLVAILYHLCTRYPRVGC